MKRLVLMIVSALICVVFLLAVSSCSKEDVGNSALSIYAFGQSTTRSAALDEKSVIEEKNLWCTGDDIKWYDATTGELKLKNIPKVPYMTFSKLTIFLDDIELFSLETANPVSSISTAFPCINWDLDVELINKGCKCGNKQDHIPGQACEPIWEYTGDGGNYYISKGYPRWHPIERDESTAHWDWDSIDAAREENWKTIEPGWSKFIEQLKKEGKYKN